ncbi:MAG: formate/nitrite transporter family protein [Oscillospiraceae bacterium]|jgi:formate/nitrite transporter|nr:formate/nitrite transporter family protein [Oscillospiraceae bacterium]
MSTPIEILEKWADSGAAKAKNKVSKLFILAIFAGAFIAIGGVAATVAGGATAYPVLNRLLGAIIFPGGLTMCLLAGSELFTGNTLILISLAHKKCKTSEMLRNWVAVYIGNFIGAALVALAIVYSGLYDSVTQPALQSALTKSTLPLSQALIRGVLCNFLVCIAVWIASGANSAPGKIAGLFFPIMLFVFSGYEHSVANMYYIPAALFQKARLGLTLLDSGVSLNGLTWSAFLVKNLIPVTLGNIVGGGCVVGLLYTFVFKKPPEVAHKRKK